MVYSYKTSTKLTQIVTNIDNSYKTITKLSQIVTNHGNSYKSCQNRHTYHVQNTAERHFLRLVPEAIWPDLSIGSQDFQGNFSACSEITTNSQNIYRHLKQLQITPGIAARKVLRMSSGSNFAKPCTLSSWNSPSVWSQNSSTACDCSVVACQTNSQLPYLHTHTSDDVVIQNNSY